MAVPHAQTGQTRKWRVEFSCVALLFFASGLTGLVYETLWFTYCARVFGNSTYAIGTVVAVFMAGLAIGSRVFGARADESARGVRLYAWLEAGVLLGALLVPVLLMAAKPLTSMIAPSSASNIIPVTVRLVVLVCVLLPPTICMGGTLPALVKHAALLTPDAGRSFSVLYGVNTLGAMAGCLMAGFVLLPAYGERLCLAAALGVNAAVILGALWCVKAFPLRVQPAAEPGKSRGHDGTAMGDPVRERWLLYAGLVLAGSASMACEVGWTRVMALLLGSSVYAFTALLSVFLVSLGLGALLAAWLLGMYRARVAWLIVLQAGIAAVLVLTVPMYDRLSFLVGVLNRALLGHFPQILALNFVVCVLIVLAPGLMIGMVIPVAVAAIRRDKGIGMHSGGIYAANTAGNIAGALAASFVLVPWLGVRHALVAAAVMNIAAAVMLAGCVVWPLRHRMGLLALCAPMLVWGLAARPWDPLTMMTGLYMYGTSIIGSGCRILYQKDGVSCNVTVTEYEGVRHLRVNGKVDASGKGDMATQLLSAHLPMLLNPGAQRVFVLGLGSGVTLGGVCRYNAARIDCAEIEERVIEASSYFNDVNRCPLVDPRVRMFADDGRNVLRHAREKYDVIISEPSNPWITGLAELFTRECFESYRDSLATNGVMCQFLQTYNLQVEDYLMIARTFASVFPYHAIYSITPPDTLLIGSQSPLTPDFARMQKVIDGTADVRKDLLDHCREANAAGLFIRCFAVDGQEYDRMCARAPRILREAHNTLEYSAARALYTDNATSVSNYVNLYRHKEQMLPQGAARPAVPDGAYVAAMIAVGDEMTQAGDTTAVLRMLTELSTVVTNKAAVDAARMRAAILASNDTIATNILDVLVEESPSDANTAVCLLVARGKPALARDAAARLYALHPDSIVAMVNHGIVLGALGRKEEARAVLRRALAHDPLSIQAEEQYQALDRQAAP